MTNLFGAAIEIMALILGLATCVWIALDASSDGVKVKAVLIGIAYSVCLAIVSIGLVAPEGLATSLVGKYVLDGLNNLPNLIPLLLGRGLFAFVTTSGLTVTSAVSLSGTEIAESELLTFLIKLISVALVVFIEVLVLIGSPIPSWLD